MKDIVQGTSGFWCECRAHRFSCRYHFMQDTDWEFPSRFIYENNLRNMYPSRRLFIVRNEHVPLKGCVVVKKFERSSIIYYT